MARNETRARFATSLIAGLLLIPVSAVAAFAIVSSASSAPPTTTEVPITAAVSTTLPAAETTSSTAVEETIVVEPVEASMDDFEAACGADGMELVELEAAETITAVQQAALDALRQVCAEAGTPLPDPPAPEPVVRTVTVADRGGSAATTTTTTYDDHGEYYDDDHDEYEDHDDDDHDEDDD